MIDTEVSKPLGKALNFNSENIFEYIESMLFNVNAEMIDPQASEILQKLCSYIQTLPLSDTSKVVFQVEDMADSGIISKNFPYRSSLLLVGRILVYLLQLQIPKDYYPLFPLLIQ